MFVHTPNVAKRPRPLAPGRGEQVGNCGLNLFFDTIPTLSIPSTANAVPLPLCPSKGQKERFGLWVQIYHLRSEQEEISIVTLKLLIVLFICSKSATVY